MKKVKVGVIGAGGIAQGMHLPAYISLKDAQVVAIADKDLTRAREAADKFKIGRVFSDYRRLLAIEDLEAVDICTPNAFHKPMTLAALKAGKHVLVEKPTAVTAAEVKAMVDAAKKAKRILMVGLNCRFRPETRILKRAIEKGALGEIYFAEAAFMRRRGIPGWGAFTQKKLSGGGPLLDLGIHVLDWALYLMGFPEPKSVSGATYDKLGKRPHRALTEDCWKWDAKKFDVEDMAVAFVRFKNGATLSLRSCWAANIAKDEFQVRLLGTEGGCQTDPVGIFREEYGALVDISPRELPEASGHAEVIRQFVNAVKAEGPCPASAESTLRAAKILDGIYRSARLGREVKIG